MIPQEIFLSHASEDRRIASPVVAELRRHGLPVWYSPHSLMGAQEWHDEIGLALRRCDWFLLLLSEHSVQSFWVRRELCYVLRQKRYLHRITPVLLRPCDYEEFSWTLGDLQFVNLSGDFETGIRNLLRVWGIGYKAL